MNRKRNIELPRSTFRTGMKSLEAGYTLLELLIVLVIIALIAGLITTQVFQYLGRAKVEAAEIQIQRLSSDLDFFRLDVGRYPTTDEGLKALLEAPSPEINWQGPYTAREENILDPWGREFHYRQPGEHGVYDLYSLGADGAEGGEGEDRDVANWTP